MARIRPLCGLLHLIGACLPILGTIPLLDKGAQSTIRVFSFSVYGTTLTTLYLSSTLYHWLPKSTGGYIITSFVHEE